MNKFIAPILTALMLVGAASAAGKIAPKPKFGGCHDLRIGKCHPKPTPPGHSICPLGSRGCSSNGHILGK